MNTREINSLLYAVQNESHGSAADEAREQVLTAFATLIEENKNLRESFASLSAESLRLRTDHNIESLKALNQDHARTIQQLRARCTEHTKRSIDVSRELDRFLAKTVTAPNGCLIWTGSDDGRQGYAKFHVGGKSVRAIRWIFEVWRGRPLRKNYVVMHTCDNPRCVEPTHLQAGTHRQNMKDKAKKGRVVSNKRFLDVDTVSLIRFASSLGASPMLIAKQIGIKYTTVRSITEGKRWKNVA